MAASEQYHAHWEKLMAAGAESSKTGKHEEAENYYEAAAKLAENFGPEGVRLGRSLLRLGHIYSFLRSSARAEPLLMRALTILERSLDPEDPDVVFCVNDLAGAYFMQGKYAEAEPLQKCFLAAREHALGLAHTEVAANIINLGTTLREQRKYDEAERLYARRLEAGEKTHGPDASCVIQIVERLAELHDEQGKYAEAELLYRRLLARDEMSEAPMTYLAARYPYRLALLCAKQGKDSEAEKFFKRSIEIYELFSSYSKQARVLDDFAQLLRRTGRAGQQLMAHYIRPESRGLIEFPQVRSSHV